MTKKQEKKVAITAETKNNLGGFSLAIDVVDVGLEEVEKCLTCFVAGVIDHVATQFKVNKDAELIKLGTLLVRIGESNYSPVELEKSVKDKLN